ncbi:hypothetical protein [Pseudonocardia sp. WMMC193]|uniref:hypothetical protein n=1 Tax=Pseudonocardia sp. WMMC193 TaxID=2911965 RepID=UPI001F367183|nr:hypothetical protein [Pseudonocardia sp. WMMC193]MCF7547231.1 hypothetical protein [Pseudonocardia sp. WMMC193]
MSFIMNEGADTRRRPSRRRRGLILSLAVVVVLVIASIAFLLGRSDDLGEHAPPTGQAPTTDSDITWQRVSGQPVPVSALHGPSRQESSGAAMGFTHDALGAALAAINISTRLSSSAGPAVYEATARMQTLGDVEGTIAAARAEVSSENAANTAATRFAYRLSGDPTGDVVVVSIAAETPQTSAMRGYAQMERTMQWVDGDWRMQVPLSRPQFVTVIDGFAPLGGPDA